jgi:MFS transporter, DHA2 family, multidrug resistance protein
LRPDQNNRASSITNFFRNWGGSFGVSFVTTMSERRANFHQARLQNSLTVTSVHLHQAIHNLSAYLQAKGFSAPDAAGAASGWYYHQLQVHAQLLAFMDCFHVLGVVTLIAAPIVLLTKPFKMSGRGGAAH